MLAPAELGLPHPEVSPDGLGAGGGEGRPTQPPVLTGAVRRSNTVLSHWPGRAPAATVSASSDLLSSDGHPFPASLSPARCRCFQGHATDMPPAPSPRCPN